VGGREGGKEGEREGGRSGDDGSPRPYMEKGREGGREGELGGHTEGSLDKLGEREVPLTYLLGISSTRSRLKELGKIPFHHRIKLLQLTQQLA